MYFLFLLFSYEIARENQPDVSNSFFDRAHAPAPIFHHHDDIDVSTRRPFSSLNFQHATGCVTSLPGIFRLATDMA